MEGEIKVQTNHRQLILIKELQKLFILMQNVILTIINARLVRCVCMRVCMRVRSDVVGLASHLRKGALIDEGRYDSMHPVIEPVGLKGVH